MKTEFSTEVNGWSFADKEHIKRKELSAASRRFIKRKEAWLESKCRRIWLARNRNDEVFLFGSFCKDRKRTVVTIACYIPYVGFVTSH